MGYASRLIGSSAPLLPRSTFDLEALAQQTRDACFFCPESVERVTPKLPPEIHEDGRIRCGAALLFPNLLPYAQYCAVSVYSPDLHYLPLDRMTPELMRNNLAAQVEYITDVTTFDPHAVWASINANHMLPSGSSVFHPHLQSAVDPFPSTVQTALAGLERGLVGDYVETEKRLGQRYIGNTGSIAWLASFAPMGFNEVRAFLPGVVSPVQLDGDRLSELGLGISTVLNLYAELGYQSFNMAIYGAPPTVTDYTCSVRLICRANLQPMYRSDVQYFERLHWQAIVDTVPEQLAERARERFSTAG